MKITFSSPRTLSSTCEGSIPIASASWKWSKKNQIDKNDLFIILHVQKDIHVSDQAKRMKNSESIKTKTKFLLPLNVVHHEELSLVEQFLVDDRYPLLSFLPKQSSHRTNLSIKSQYLLQLE
jgi:hypothetical protein